MVCKLVQCVQVNLVIFTKEGHFCDPKTFKKHDRNILYSVSKFISTATSKIFSERSW